MQTRSVFVSRKEYDELEYRMNETFRFLQEWLLRRSTAGEVLDPKTQEVLIFSDGIILEAIR